MKDMLEYLINEFLYRFIIVTLGLLFTFVAIFNPKVSLQAMKNALRNYPDL